MKRKLFATIAMTIALGAVGCAKTAKVGELDTMLGGEQAVNILPRVIETIESEHDIPSETENYTDSVSVENISLIMVKGKLYYDTGEESTMDGRCGNMDGAITSEVPADEFPMEEGQTNNPTLVGCGYQYGLEGYIEVQVNDNWYVFKQVDIEYGISTLPMEVLMEVTDYTDGIITLMIDNQSGYVYTYGEDFSLEKLDDSGAWNKVQCIESDCGWKDIAHELQDLETVEIKHDLSIFGTLTSGTYRIWKSDVCAEFEIP